MYTAYSTALFHVQAALPKHLRSTARAMVAAMESGTDELQALAATRFGPNDAAHRAKVHSILKRHGIAL